jgi:DNA-binding LacI/PurR family transcriptional regulator
MVANSYFGSIADAVVRAADRQSLDVVFASTLNHSQKQLDYVEILTGRDVSGIIYAGNYASNPALAEAISAGMPVVVIDEALTDVPPVDSVLVDDYAGAYNATSYLAALGHESVALVTGPASLRSVEERTRGWRDALTHAEIDAGKQLRISGPFSVQFGAAALSSILAARERPTAVFAASDPIALGMMVAARSLGMDIPNDLSVVGFDGLPESELISPRLTTVRTPLETMAEEAISLLTARMAGADHEPTTTVVAVSLTVRDSAAGPRIHSLS